jgi:5'(3')-deoxyribonucleotidase
VVDEALLVTKKPVIAVDIDDVLVPTDRYVAMRLEERFGCRIRPAEVRTKKLIGEVMELTGQSEREVAAAVQEVLLSPEFAGVPPMEGTDRVLRKLGRTYEIVTITARSPEFQEPTRVWVKRHFSDLVSSMYFPNNVALTDAFVHVDKNAALKETGAVWLIDDSPSHFDLGGLEIRGILFGDYPWNRVAELPAGVVRAVDWGEVEKLLM